MRFSYAGNIFSYVGIIFSYVGIIFWYVDDIYLYVLYCCVWWKMARNYFLLIYLYQSFDMICGMAVLLLEVVSPCSLWRAAVNSVVVSQGGFTLKAVPPRIPYRVAVL